MATETHLSFLRRAKLAPLWTALLFIAICLIAFAIYHPIGGRNGGTAVEYALGSIATALIVWLMWLGVRKRQYALESSRLSRRLSGHVYLGATLLLLVPLHAGFGFSGFGGFGGFDSQMAACFPTQLPPVLPFNSALVVPRLSRR